jgi:UDP-N-acetylmuramoylalanine--D-glutamate ligase
MSELAGKNVVVLGLARSGEAAARALIEAGARVTVLDAADDEQQRERAAQLAGARALLGRTDGADVDGADVVVSSPGVPWSSAWIERALARGVPVWSEVELAYRLGVRPLVGITGTNGKTTTTEMTVAALRAAGRDAVAAGNVGRALVGADTSAAVFAELSSFQLQGIDTFRVPVAVLLNVAHDHIDWHGSHEAYARAKARIFENQTSEDVAIVHDDEVCRSLARGDASTILFADDRLPPGGAGVDDGWIVVPQGRVVELSMLRTSGRPNRADAVAAAAAACALGVEPREVGDALAGFEPRPHRIEHVATVDGVTYINDSKATDPHATLAALEGMSDVVLIAGGRNKGIDLSELADGAAHLHAVVAIGESAADIVAAFSQTGIPVEKAGSMDEAVARARELADGHGSVLLSPACASFDMYRNYEARGDAFRAAVRKIEGSKV